MRPGEKEILAQEMVADYLLNISVLIHPSQLLYWAYRAIEQGVSLENVRTDV